MAVQLPAWMRAPNALPPNWLEQAWQQEMPAPQINAPQVGSPGAAPSPTPVVPGGNVALPQGFAGAGNPNYFGPQPQTPGLQQILNNLFKFNQPVTPPPNLLQPGGPTGGMALGVNMGDLLLQSPISNEALREMLLKRTPEQLRRLRDTGQIRNWEELGITIPPIDTGTSMGPIAPPGLTQPIAFRGPLGRRYGRPTII